MESIDTIVIGAGQTGLATSRELQRIGIAPVVLERGPRAAGSWPAYYDSLTLFSPARFSALPGMLFPGDPDRYPHRDEVADYLEAYARALDVDVRVGSEVAAVRDAGGDGFLVELVDGTQLHARSVVAATGSFANPYVPRLAGLEQFGGTLLHAADYRAPDQLAERRVVVVGAGNTAVQVAIELADVADVTLASRTSPRFAPQLILGHDFHVWATRTGLARVPSRAIPRRFRGSGGNRVLDVGAYREAIERGRPLRRPMFRELDAAGVTWDDGTSEQVDAVLLATGYRPALGYLEPLRTALDGSGTPIHAGGVSTTIPGLYYVGLSGQRTFASAALLGVGRDARVIARGVARHLAVRVESPGRSTQVNAAPAT